jgi:predicted peptidase
VLFVCCLLGPVFAQRIEGQESRRLDIEGTTLQYSFVFPPDYQPGQTYPLLLALPPGEGASNDVSAILRSYFRDEARSRGWIVVAPLAPGDRFSRTPFFLGSETLIPPLLDALAEEFTFEGGKAHLAGVSNGGTGAFRVATLYPERFHSLMVLPGTARDEDLARIDTLAGMPVRLYVGENEAEAEAELTRVMAAALEEGGAVAELLVVPENGHVLNSLTPGEIFDWFDNHRQ